MEAVTLLFPFPQVCSICSNHHGTLWAGFTFQSKAGFGGITSQRHSLQHHQTLPKPHSLAHDNIFSLWGRSRSSW